MSEPTTTDQPITAVHRLVKESLTDVQIDHLCKVMGIKRKYQFQWYMNNPKRWPAAQAVAFAKVFDLELEYCVTQYEIGYDELAAVINS